MQAVYKKIAALLVCCSMAGLLAAKKKADTTEAATQQKRALHALDRLTFGPRPGDVQAVATMGVDKWIELQLHPEKINNSALDARLAQYGTLRMSAREMTLNFPSPQLLKRGAAGQVADAHDDPYRHAIYSANLMRLEDKQEAKQAASLTAVAANTSSPTMTTTESNQKAKAESVRHTRIRVASAPGVRCAIESARSCDAYATHPGAIARAAGRYLSRHRRAWQATGACRTDGRAARNCAGDEINPAVVVYDELQSAKLLRAAYSDRQLEEVLTDFWFNHFNVYLTKGADHYLVTSYERDVIRPHVLGKFEDLLLATAQSPAMLVFLDNWQSVGPNSDDALGIKEHAAQNPRVRWRNTPFGPRPVIYQPRPPQQGPQVGSNPNAQQKQKRRSGLNENYARELMELHTLGVNGGYTQHDVTEVARVFTGWTVQNPREGGGFVFKPRLHEPGAKTVLGHQIKENGAQRRAAGARHSRSFSGHCRSSSRLSWPNALSRIILLRRSSMP